MAISTRVPETEFAFTSNPGSGIGERRILVWLSSEIETKAEDTCIPGQLEYQCQFRYLIHGFLAFKLLIVPHLPLTLLLIVRYSIFTFQVSCVVKMEHSYVLTWLLSSNLFCKCCMYHPRLYTLHLSAW